MSELFRPVPHVRGLLEIAHLDGFILVPVSVNQFMGDYQSRSRPHVYIAGSLSQCINRFKHLIDDLYLSWVEGVRRAPHLRVFLTACPVSRALNPGGLLRFRYPLADLFGPVRRASAPLLLIELRNVPLQFLAFTFSFSQLAGTVAASLDYALTHNWVLVIRLLALTAPTAAFWLSSGAGSLTGSHSRFALLGKLNTFCFRLK